MANRDVVLTTVHRVRFEYAANFLASLRRTGYRGEIVFFASATDEETMGELRRQGVTVIPFRFSGKHVSQRLARLWFLWRWCFKSPLPMAIKEKLAHAVFHLFYRRHLLYLQFLREHRRDYDRVFLTDCRDVYFQADPFSWNPPPGVHLFLEEGSNTIGASPHHCDWLTSQFGQAVLDELKAETISCAGTVFGDLDSILKFLSAMVSQTMAARSLREIAGDQGIHNYILYKQRLPEIILHDNWHGPVMTLGATPPEAVQLNAQGRVINANREVVPVLHQYDRIPQVEKALLGRGNEMPAGKL